MEKKIRLGVIGIGNMGSAHAKAVALGQCPQFVLSAVADTDPCKLAWSRENLGKDVHCFENALDMLDSGLIDACIVAMPHYDHPKYVIECIRRGIHVMSEKPAGVYTLQVRQMNEMADAHPDVVFGMMFNQRTNHVYRKIHEMVHSGIYGAIRRVNWIITNWYRPQAYYDSGSWRATWAGEGGGVLLNQCPHQLDLLQWICGMPVRVQAHLHYGKWHDIEVEDDVTAYMEFENGATGVFVTTTADICGTNRLEIQLERGKIVAQNDQLEFTEYAVSEPEFSQSCTDSFGKPQTKEQVIETDGQNTQHIGVLRAWGDAILGKAPLVADGREGIRSLMLSNAMHLSSWTGKMVELPFDEQAHYEMLKERIAASSKKGSADTQAGGQSVNGVYKQRWNTNW